MILKFELPPQIDKAVLLSEGERVYYALPIDVDRDNLWTDDSYLVVTTRRVLIFYHRELYEEINISELSEAKAEPRVGGGLLTVRYKGQSKLLLHFSSKHISRYAYIARGINILADGRTEEVVSNEYEKICPKCGHVIPGTRYCPHCSKEGSFFRTFLRMAKPYKKKFVFIGFLMILASLTTLLNPEIQKHLVDDVLIDGEGSLSTAFLCLSGMFALSIGISIVNVLKSYSSTKLGATIAKDLRADLFAKLQSLPLSFINDRRPGELLNRVMQDTRSIRDFMERAFCNLFTVAFIFVCDVIFMLVLNARLALMSFVFAPVAVFITVAFRKVIHRRFHLQWKKNDDVSSNLQDVISGMRVVKSYGNERAESNKFLKFTNEFCRVQMSNEVFWAIFNPLIGLIVGAGVFVVVYFGGLDVLAGDMTAGELFQFITYTQLLYQYLNWMTNLPRQLTNLVSSLERINDILAQSAELENKTSDEEIDIVGEVTFENATFGYKSYQPVLENINLTVKPGEMIGIVGASGTGKSTLINLLMGLYEVDDGRILVDGVDIKKISREKFHSQLGVVLQETFLFSGTIINNIRFSKPDATQEEVIRAAKLANAHDFICRTPNGYNTYVGEKGYNLSGGERQRIAIARAILNDPKLLILDEATASLDTESEYMIQKALENLTSGKTTFAIAHRLSTLQNADRLMVIDGHRIAEIGTHEELIAAKGIYYKLLKAQLDMQNPERKQAEA